MVHLQTSRLLRVAIGAALVVAAAPAASAAQRAFQHGGDAWLQVTFQSRSQDSSSRVDSSGERFSWSLSHDWEVTGVLEVRTLVPAPGKRVFHVLGVAGELQGRLTESHGRLRRGVYGEGGLSAVDEDWQEAWVNPAVAIPTLPASFALEIDLDARTWTAPELADTFDALPRVLHATERYFGRWDPPATFGEPVLSFDKQRPPPDLLGSSPLRPSNLEATLLGLDRMVAASNPLTAMVKPKGGADRLVGSVEATIQRGKGKYTGSVLWAVLRELPGLELEVTIPEGERWLPHGDRLPLVAGRLPGARLRITAEVKDPTGAPVHDVRIRRLRWWLEETSRLPGVCMNWPYGSGDTSPDMEFDAKDATDEGQRLEFTNLTTLRKSVYVVPYDFGAWSTLRVEADLDDGRTLSGKYRGQTDHPTAIRLPLRSADSKVASRWKRLMGVDGRPDDADDEDHPKGAVNGDGLSLFEEYRGFYVDTKYVRGDPTLKDVFVYDPIDSADTRAAITLFTSASRALVSVLHPGHDEHDHSRVINRNRGAGPSRGHQHTVSLRIGGPWSRPDASGNRPGRGEVLVTPPAKLYQLAPRHAGRQDLYVRAIAQAMLAACGVSQPGAYDRGMEQFTASRDPAGNVVVHRGDGKVVKVRDESGQHDLGAEWLEAAERQAEVVRRRLRRSPLAAAALAAATNAAATRSYYVAVRGGQHSGPVGNIMRDAFADALWVPGTITLHVLPTGDDPKVGYALTETSVGDDFNAAPRRRFGDSARPPARQSFVVNDNAR